MYFEIVGEITDVKTIAVGGGIRDAARLRKRYGTGRWRKLKGVATVRLANNRIRQAEVHWYQAHGIGRSANEDQAVCGLDGNEAAKDPVCPLCAQ